MTDALKVYLPDPEHAKRMGWKYHVQWFDAGRPCWFRRKTAEEARDDFRKLAAEGWSPFVVDAITGEPVAVEVRDE